MSDRPVVSAADAEAALGEELVDVEVYLPASLEPFVTVKRSEIAALDLAGGAIAWKRDGKTHRIIGAILHTRSVESRIIKPV